MKASYGWLKSLLGNALTLSPREVADRFTGAGLEVEAIHEFGAASATVLVARVVAKEPHPSRAKLSLVTVELGGGRTIRVVCGAPNVPDPGGLVVFAPLGTHLPAKGLTLEPREIAGVASEGMLCSEAELGLRIQGGDGGILLLPEGTAEPGTTLARAIPESHDHVLEIGLTPNRPDGLGHVGLARELAALLAVPFTRPAPRPARTSATIDPNAAVSIAIDDEERCPSYGAALVEGVTVAPSPLGAQWRLEALGVRAISNVVDITNLVMLEYGHPIHGFDRARIAGNRITVRRARAGEAMTTLDGVARTLSEDDLVIADASGPVALAGVMGGAGSEIQSDTRDVLVECAYFAPRSVRRTARRYGMHTESSHRFERGVDPSDVDDVLGRTAELLVAWCGGTAGERTRLVGPGVPARAPAMLRKARMDALLGVEVDFGEARAILERLGLRVVGGSVEAGELALVPPHHRPDLAMEADCIEEVIRVHGIDRVAPVVPALRPQAPRAKHDIGARVTRAAIEVGLSQALVFGFTSDAALAAVGAPASHLRLLNPLTEDRSVMRTSLLPGLLEAVTRARRHNVDDARLFAVGARFLPDSTGARTPREVASFAAVIAGRRDAVLAKPEPIDVWDAKGVALAIAHRATGGRAEAVPQPADARSPHLHPRAAAHVVVDGQVVGSFGLLHPEVASALDLAGPCAIVELCLETLGGLGVKIPRFRPIPALPAATRDLAVVVHDAVPAGQVERAIAEVGGELVESVELFDLFRGASIPEEHRSLAFHVVYRDPKAAKRPDEARTLTDAEVDQRHAAVVRAVGERFGAQLRA